MKLLFSLFTFTTAVLMGSTMRRIKNNRRHRFKPIFTILAVFGLAMGLSAQEMFKVSGIVKDELGNPLAGANINIKGYENISPTNFDGFYEISVDAGERTLVFSYIGKSVESRTVVVSQSLTLDIQLFSNKNVEILDEVFVSAIRVNNESPVTYSNLKKEDIAPRNLGQDIPVLMNFLPSVVTTSDAGAGIGYTGIRVRGSDATRVNVTINGIPYNDAESQGTFWVNMPDFASSTESLQLQRGVGTSTNGAGAFGASLNLLTDGFSEEAYGQISSSFGSFNTLRNNIKFSTGLLNDHVEISGRLSRITSDGYIDRASSELDSYFLQGAYKDDNTLIKALLFGGHEITYQAWFGIDVATLESDRTFNPAGIYTDENGNTQFYDKEEDNYKQDHAQLLWNEQLNEKWSTNIAL
ncbi:MAG: carboxypeptidase-like regulatory domain-containing protein, partial [Flavobacteriaceae bacterium]